LNVGSAPLTVTNFAHLSGSNAFTAPGVTIPINIAPGVEVDTTLKFQPAATGDAFAVFQLTSNDPITPTVSVPMSGTGS